MHGARAWLAPPFRFVPLPRRGKASCTWSAGGQLSPNAPQSRTRRNETPVRRRWPSLACGPAMTQGGGHGTTSVALSGSRSASVLKALRDREKPPAGRRIAKPLQCDNGPPLILCGTASRTAKRDARETPAPPPCRVAPAHDPPVITPRLATPPPVVSRASLRLLSPPLTPRATISRTAKRDARETPPPPGRAAPAITHPRSRHASRCFPPSRQPRTLAVAAASGVAVGVGSHLVAQARLLRRYRPSRTSHATSAGSRVAGPPVPAPPDARSSSIRSGSRCPIMCM